MVKSSYQKGLSTAKKNIRSTKHLNDLLPAHVFNLYKKSKIGYELSLFDREQSFFKGRMDGFSKYLDKNKIAYKK